MLVSTADLLGDARSGGYAVGAFNVYNLEGARAVIAAAEAERSPVMLQLHPGALAHGSTPLVAGCLAAAREATVPASVHLDHSTSPEEIGAALDVGLRSVMADGSHLEYADNVAFVRQTATRVHSQGGVVEAELGRLTGTEDGLTVPEYESRLTDPEQAGDFVRSTGVDALAVCIGNVHGSYPGEPRLDFDRLSAIREATPVPLVLHGGSGLPEPMLARAIELGVCKVNVNTELRRAYLAAVTEAVSGDGRPDLADLMQAAIGAMQPVVAEKLRLFRSTGRA